MKKHVEGRSAEPSPVEDLMANARLPAVAPTSAVDIIAELKRRTYDPDASLRYCKAARSHTPLGSPERAVWVEAVALLTAASKPNETK